MSRKSGFGNRFLSFSEKNLSLAYLSYSGGGDGGRALMSS
jgi:hypothetical protein